MPLTLVRPTHIMAASGMLKPAGAAAAELGSATGVAVVLRGPNCSVASACALSRRYLPVGGALFIKCNRSFWLHFLVSHVLWLLEDSVRVRFRHFHSCVV